MTKQISKNETGITQGILLSQINDFIKSTNIKIPANYDVGKNMASFCLKLKEVKDKYGKPAVECCTTESIIESAQKIITKGYDITKDHAYLIIYGNKLTVQVSYFGNEDEAKRFAGVKDIHTQIVWKGDKLDYEIIDGNIKINKHTQKLENITGNQEDIEYVYSTIIYIDDRPNKVNIMCMSEIKKAWANSQTNLGVHKQFPVKMAKKTCINSTLREIINATNDAVIDYKPDDDELEYSEAEVIDVDNDFGEAVDIDDYNEEPIEEEFEEEELTQGIADIPEESVVIDLENQEYHCKECGEKLNKAVINFYEKQGKEPELCYNCQQKARGKK